ncbi:5'-nucleotidase [Mycobacterium attenuatum]|uniref:Tyrosine-protein kinase PtkA n=1 Tax=Mycobacterium attenuatum TaxID=2341086 RepID=A0A498Q8K6_9MYCO|nr:5'-nucleotidase [Mycobacterium attenuatum]
MPSLLAGRCWAPRRITDNGCVTGSIAADSPTDCGAARRSTTASDGSPQLVIFDLDGTLTDSAQGIVASFRHALEHVGADIPERDLAAWIVGPPMDDTFRSMELGDRVEAAIAAFRAEYGARGWAMNTVFDGIAPLLGDLRAAGVRLAVATCKLEHTARRILAHFELEQHFEVVAGATGDGSRSTKTEVLAHALAQLGPLPERVLMIGDRSHDVEGAAAHGIDTVVVGWGYGQDDVPTGADGVRRAGTIDELREALGV